MSPLPFLVLVSCFSFLIQVRLPSSLPTLLISENQLWLHWFSVVSCFLFYWFILWSLLFSFFSLLWIWFLLSFLRWNLRPLVWDLSYLWYYKHFFLLYMLISPPKICVSRISQILLCFHFHSVQSTDFPFDFLFAPWVIKFPNNLGVMICLEVFSDCGPEHLFYMTWIF